MTSPSELKYDDDLYRAIKKLVAERLDQMTPDGLDPDAAMDNVCGIVSAIERVHVQIVVTWLMSMAKGVHVEGALTTQIQKELRELLESCFDDFESNTRFNLSRRMKEMGVPDFTANSVNQKLAEELLAEIKTGEN